MPSNKYQEMYEMYLSGKTLTQVAESFGITKQGVSKAFKARGYETRGLTGKRNKASLVALIDDDYLLEHKKTWIELDSKVKGVIAESNVKNKLAELGFDVWIPYMNNHRADVGIFYQDKLITIQVKSATYDPKTKRFRTMLQTKDKRRRHVSYERGDCDFFVLFCPGVIDMYVIPAEVGIANHAVNMMPHRDRIYRGTGIDWEIYKNAWHLLTS